MQKLDIKKLKNEIIYWAKTLNQRGFVIAGSGNISTRINSNQILITTHNSYLGELKQKRIILINKNGDILEQTKYTITSEKNIHLAIYNQFNEYNVILHAHSPYTTAFFLLL